MSAQSKFNLSIALLKEAIDTNVMKQEEESYKQVCDDLKSIEQAITDYIGSEEYQKDTDQEKQMFALNVLIETMNNCLLSFQAQKESLSSKITKEYTRDQLIKELSKEYDGPNYAETFDMNINRWMSLNNIKLKKSRKKTLNENKN